MTLKTKCIGKESLTRTIPGMINCGVMVAPRHVTSKRRPDAPDSIVCCPHVRHNSGAQFNSILTILKKIFKNLNLERRHVPTTIRKFLLYDFDVKFLRFEDFQDAIELGPWIRERCAER